MTITTLDLFKTFATFIDDPVYNSSHDTPIVELTPGKMSGWDITILMRYTLEEGSADYYYTRIDTKDMVEWATEQLKDWKFCTRREHNVWHFRRRKDAEKFITLFNLRWAR